MAPGLMVSLSPVVAASERGRAQKAPGRRGKNRKSMSASGKARSSVRPASSSALRPPNPVALAGEPRTSGAYDTTAMALQDSQTCAR